MENCEMADRIAETFMNHDLKAGHGAVIGIFGGQPLFHGDRDGVRIDAQVDDEFLLDCHCIGAMSVFGTVYVAYRLPDSPGITIEQYVGERIFSRINAERRNAEENIPASTKEDSNEGISYIGQWPVVEAA